MNVCVCVCVIVITNHNLLETFLLITELLVNINHNLLENNGFNKPHTSGHVKLLFKPVHCYKSNNKEKPLYQMIFNNVSSLRLQYYFIT